MREKRRGEEMVRTRVIVREREKEKERREDKRIEGW